MVDYRKLGDEPADMRRPAPAMRDFGKTRQRKLDGVYAPELIAFLNSSRVPTEVVANVARMAGEQGFSHRYSNKQPFVITNKNSNAFALVKPGRGRNRLRRGIRMVLTHVDSPCLKLKPSPTLLDGNDEQKAMTSGVLLDTEPYGGIEASQWAGRDVKLIGWALKKGRKRKIEIPFHTPIFSLHTQDEDAAITEDELKLMTGLQSVQEVYKLFGIERESDFASIRAHIVPDVTARRMGANMITGYGLDDRLCVYSACKALFESDPETPSIVFGLDKEEMGSSGPSNAYFGFFRKVLAQTVRTLTPGSKKQAQGLEELIENGLLQGYPIISADVEAGSTHFEASHEGVCESGIGKFGFGPGIYCHESNDGGNTVSAIDLDYFITLFSETLGKTEEVASRRFQVIGSPLKPSEGEAGGTLADLFAKQNIPIIDIGVPVGGLHNPVETVNVVDFYWYVQAIRAYFGERPSHREGKKRKFG